VTRRVFPSLLCLGFLLTLPALTHAQGTRLWNENSFDEWEKGVPNGVAIASDGTLSPGLHTETVAQLNAADVWAVASDKSGDAFVATGSPAQVLRIAPDGKQTVLFTAKALSVQTLAMGPDGALYAATLPSGKVYRIPVSNAKPLAKPLDEATATVVFDSTAMVEKPKYIWALEFDHQGRMYVATGAPGAVYRVDPKSGAKPELFFASDEPHIRSMIFAPNGDLLAGTDGAGLVYRLDPSGKGIVLYEAAKREVTALAFGAQGQLYVAAVGEKGRDTSLPALPVSGSGAVASSSISITVVQPGSAQSVSSNATIQDGSEVDVIPADPTQAPRRIVAAHDDVIYALRAVPDGVLAATGNRGRIYRIHDDGSFEDMAHADAAQVTGFAEAPGGSLYLPAANSGKLLKMQLAPAAGGTLLSDVFDATEPAQWGSAEVTSGAAAGSALLEVRTGNIDNPARGWSGWKPAANGLPFGAVTIPARFAQWRLTLKPGARVSAVGLNYLPANAAPEVDEILVATGTRVNAQAMQPSYPQQTVLNFASQGGAAVNIDTTNAASPLSAYRDKSSITVRWAAHDDNNDDLRFAVYFRGEGESDWRLLRKNLSDRYLSFDAALLPDGPYRLKIVATDAPSQPLGHALTGERVSDLFLVDTETPQVTGLIGTRAGDGLHVTATATDGKVPVTHAEYSVDAGPWQYVEPVGRISDALTERYDFTVSLPEATRAGAHIVTLRAFDRFDNQGSARVQVQ
jgi:sugar lactone lactonase YvrE